MAPTAPLEAQALLEMELPTANSTLLNDVITGMVMTKRSHRKTLSPMHLYSEHGMQLYHKLSVDPSYYLIPAEEQILRNRTSMDLLLHTLRSEPVLHVTSMGPGSGHKDCLLFEYLVGHLGTTCRYDPIDVCVSACTQASELIVDSLKSFGGDSRFVADSRSVGMEFIQGLQQSRDVAEPRLITYFGSTFGNFRPPSDLEHLEDLARSMRMQDHLLMGLDMMHGQKSVEQLEAAYNNEPTKEWVMYLLDHLNQNIGTGFQRSDFEYIAYFDGGLSGIRTTLVANTDITMPIPGTEHVIRFRAGEELEVEVSMKPRLQDFTRMLRKVGLQVVQRVVNDKYHYYLWLLRKVAPEDVCDTRSAV